MLSPTSVQAQASACKAQRTPGCRVRPKRVLFPEYTPAHSSTPLGNAAHPHPLTCPLSSPTPAPPAPRPVLVFILLFKLGEWQHYERAMFLSAFSHEVSFCGHPSWPSLLLSWESASLFFFFLVSISVLSYPVFLARPPHVAPLCACSESVFLYFSLSCCLSPASSSFLVSSHSWVSRLLGLCLGFPSLSLPRPLPDSGPSHLRGKVNI